MFRLAFLLALALWFAAIAAAYAGDKITITDANGRTVIIEDGKAPVYLPLPRTAPPAPRATVSETYEIQRTYVIRPALVPSVAAYSEYVYLPAMVTAPPVAVRYVYAEKRRFLPGYRLR